MSENYSKILKTDPGILARYAIRVQQSVEASSSLSAQVEYEYNTAEPFTDRYLALGGSEEVLANLRDAWTKIVPGDYHAFKGDADEHTHIHTALMTALGAAGVLETGVWRKLLHARVVVIYCAEAGGAKHVRRAGRIVSTGLDSVVFGNATLEEASEADDAQVLEWLLPALFDHLIECIKSGDVEREFVSELGRWQMRAPDGLPPLPYGEAAKDLAYLAYGFDPERGDAPDILRVWAEVMHAIDDQSAWEGAARRESILMHVDAASVAEMTEQAYRLADRLSRGIEAHNEKVRQALSRRIGGPLPQGPGQRLSLGQEAAWAMLGDLCEHPTRVFGPGLEHNVSQALAAGVPILVDAGLVTAESVSESAVRLSLTDEALDLMAPEDEEMELDEYLRAPAKIGSDYLELMEFVGGRNSGKWVDVEGRPVGGGAGPGASASLARARLFSFDTEEVATLIDRLLRSPRDLVGMYAEDETCEHPVDEALSYWEESDSCTPYPSYLPYPSTYIGFTGSRRLVVWVEESAWENEAHEATSLLSEWWLRFPPAGRDVIAVQGVLLTERGDAWAVLSMHTRGREPGFGLTPIARDGVWPDAMSIWPRFVTALVSAINDHHTVVKATKFALRDSRRRTKVNHGLKENLDLAIRARRFHKIQMKQGYFAERERKGSGGTGAVRTFRILVRKHSWCRHIRGMLPLSVSQRERLESTEHRAHPYRVYRYGEPMDKETRQELRKRLILPPQRGEWIAVLLIKKGPFWHPDDMSLPERETIHVTDPKVVQQNEEWTDEITDEREPTDDPAPEHVT